MDDKLGAGNIRPVTADAETLDAEPGHFELAGYIRSTSFLPPSVLGDRGAAFDDNLAASIGSFAADDGTFSQEVGFVYDLACKLPG
jgi:hypothetical protein